MFEAIQYLVSSKKLEDGFFMDNVVVVNNTGKISRSCVLHDILIRSYRLEMNQTNDFRYIINVLRDPRAFHE